MVSSLLMGLQISGQGGTLEVTERSNILSRLPNIRSWYHWYCVFPQFHIDGLLFPLRRQQKGGIIQFAIHDWRRKIHTAGEAIFGGIKVVRDLLKTLDIFVYGTMSVYLMFCQRRRIWVCHFDLLRSSSSSSYTSFAPVAAHTHFLSLFPSLSHAGRRPFIGWGILVRMYTCACLVFAVADVLNSFWFWLTSAS